MELSIEFQCEGTQCCPRLHAELVVQKVVTTSIGRLEELQLVFVEMAEIAFDFAC